MIGYHYWVLLHGVLGAVALATFWSAAVFKKGSPKHRLIGKVFLCSMVGIVLTGIPLVIEFAYFRKQSGTALFLAFLLPLTAQACWVAWRAVTDKKDWKRLVARPGWAVAKWLPFLMALPVMGVGLKSGQPIFIGFAVIPLITGLRMHRFAKRGPDRGNWHVVMHYQAMLGAGIATHVAFLSIGMRPLWAWVSAHTAVPKALIDVFPWFAPVAVALVAGVFLDRKYNRKAKAPSSALRAPSPAVREKGESVSA